MVSINDIYKNEVDIISMYILFNNVIYVKLDFKMLVKIKRKSMKMQNIKIF